MGVQLWVKQVEPIKRGFLQATFTVEVEGFGAIEQCRYVETDTGAFVTGPSYKSEYARGGWAKPVTFEEEAAAELLAIVQAHMCQEKAA